MQRRVAAVRTTAPAPHAGNMYGTRGGQPGAAGAWRHATADEARRPPRRRAAYSSFLALSSRMIAAAPPPMSASAAAPPGTMRCARAAASEGASPVPALPR